MSDDDLDEDFEAHDQIAPDFDPAQNVLAEEVERVFREAPAIELISLDPFSMTSESDGEEEVDDEAADGADESGTGAFAKGAATSLFSDRPPAAGSSAPRFHDFAVLGSVRLDDSGVRSEVLEAVRRGIAESRGESDLCWEPRHGVRAILDGITADLVICYECEELEVYYSGRQLNNLLTTWKPSLILNRILVQAGVPVASSDPSLSLPRTRPAAAPSLLERLVSAVRVR